MKRFLAGARNDIDGDAQDKTWNDMDGDGTPIRDWGSGNKVVMRD
jgi:hypothetical protein